MGPKRPSRFRSVVLSDASQWLPKTRGSCMLVSYRVMCALQPLLSAPCSLTVCNCSTNAARLKRAGTAGCIIMYLSCTVSAHLAWRLEPRFGSRRPAKLACYMRAITDNAQSAACVGRTPFKAYATTNGTRESRIAVADPRTAVAGRWRRRPCGLHHCSPLPLPGTDPIISCQANSTSWPF